MKKFFLFCAGLVLSSFGGSLMIKMNLGQSTFSAFSYGVSLLTGIKIGYISILYNVCVIMAEITLLRREFQFLQLFQMIPGFISGIVLNFFMYDFVYTSQIHIN